MKKEGNRIYSGSHRVVKDDAMNSRWWGNKR